MTCFKSSPSRGGSAHDGVVIGKTLASRWAYEAQQNHPLLPPVPLLLHADGSRDDVAVGLQDVCVETLSTTRQQDRKSAAGSGSVCCSWLEEEQELALLGLFWRSRHEDLI